MAAPAHVVLGAGPVGRAVAEQLAARGDRVRVITRSGSGPQHELIERVAADATDADALAPLVDGAAALYNCASPRYDRWATEWPPLAAAVLEVARRTGAVLAITSNIYAYGLVDGPITEQTPFAPNTVKGRVRAAIWRDALAAHEAGEAVVTEVRGSEYIGPHAQAQFDDRVLARLVAGKPISITADPTCAHTWTYTGDVARLLITVAADPRAHGRAWHVPSGPPRTATAVAADLCRIAGVDPVKVGRVPTWALPLIGLVIPPARGLREMASMHGRPFTVDSSLAQATFALEPTPWDEVLQATVKPALEARDRVA